MTLSIPSWIEPSHEVAAAKAEGLAIVALESTVLTHGLPRPLNHQIATTLEGIIRGRDAIPATIALLGGNVHLGLDEEQLRYLALESGAEKVSRRDLGVVRANGLDGGTTVSATMIVAAASHVRLFATGGIGGVHRGNQGDVSADMFEFARTPVAVVCAGAKSILDLPRTLEWLETAGVPVIGFETDKFPAFYSRDSELPVSAVAKSAEHVASMIAAHWDSGLRSGIVIASPCPEEFAVDPETVEEALKQAESEAQRDQISGKALSPFLLARLAELTKGATLQANKALLENNAAIAADVARSYQRLQER